MNKKKSDFDKVFSAWGNDRMGLGCIDRRMD